MSAAEWTCLDQAWHAAERQRSWAEVAEPLLAAVERGSPADRDANVHGARPVRHDEGLAR